MLTNAYLECAARWDDRSLAGQIAAALARSLHLPLKQKTKELTVTTVMTRWLLARILACLLIAAMASFVGGCDGASATSSVAPARAATTIRSPGICKQHYSHIYVTIADVRVSPAADQKTSAYGQDFRDLTPGLSRFPLQVDLMGPTYENKVLETLGSASLPAGQYRQIRLMLLDNVPAPTRVMAPVDNECASLGGDIYNCVERTDGSKAPLELSADQVQHGVAIGAAQLLGGTLQLSAARQTDINIDIQACDSVAAENSALRLRPIVRAGILDQTPLDDHPMVVARRDSVAGSITADALPLSPSR